MSAPVAVQAATLKVEHDMSLCEQPPAGQAYILASISGLKDTDGNIRAQVYSDKPEEFLEKGKKLVRVDVKVEADGQKICVPVPAPGRYALAILHDRNANGKADFFSEGFGFSNNPKLALSPPDAEEVIFDVPEGVNNIEVTLKYVFGADEEQTQKRRQLRRR